MTVNSVSTLIILSRSVISLTSNAYVPRSRVGTKNVGNPPFNSRSLSELISPSSTTTISSSFAFHFPFSVNPVPVIVNSVPGAP